MTTPESELGTLNAREREIVHMVAKGYPNKTIAAVLEISLWTVGTHLRRIFAKLHVSSRAAMVARMIETGEPESEQGEQFLGLAFRGIGRLVRRAAPMLKTVARIAAPIAGKTVAGFLGGPTGGSKTANLAASQLREQELGDLEFGELRQQELAEHEVMAEAMANYAAVSESEYESEAMIGAAVTITLSQRDRRALRRLVPNLVRGAAILTRILRMRRVTRPFVRVVPTIVRMTAYTLRKGAIAGRPITRRRAGLVMAQQTRRVLSSPRDCRALLRQNIQATRSHLLR